MKGSRSLTGLSQYEVKETGIISKRKKEREKEGSSGDILFSRQLCCLVRSEIPSKEVAVLDSSRKMDEEPCCAFKIENCLFGTNLHEQAYFARCMEHNRKAIGLFLYWLWFRLLSPMHVKKQAVSQKLRANKMCGFGRRHKSPSLLLLLERHRTTPLIRIRKKKVSPGH